MSTSSVRVLVLTCSTRPGALGPSITSWLIDALDSSAARAGVELIPVSLADLALPFLDEPELPSSGGYLREHTRRWSALVADADGIIAVTPEYNYGMPATLKNALDYLGEEWAWKPIGFVSYGNTSAGTRGVQHAKQVATTLRLVPLGATVAIRISEAVEARRLRADPNRNAAAVHLLDELVSLARVLEPMRARIQANVKPGPIAGAFLRPLSPRDAAEVTVLQRCCWVDEARANHDLDLAALTESVDDVSGWLADWNAWGLWMGARLAGTVRAREVHGDWHIGRLAVVPDLRGAGVGGWLLRQAQDAAPVSVRRIILSTGARSTANIAFYQRAGFAILDSATAGIITLGKDRAQSSPSEPVLAS